MEHEARWKRLDNAGKLFAPTSNVLDPNVFRCACQLYEDIDPILLQQALDETIERVPYFRSVIKKGFFWYYLEESAFVPKVEVENLPPLHPIYSRDRRSLLFRLSYYKKRINLEVFHALTDGTGAMQFLQYIVMAYLRFRHGDLLGQEPGLLPIVQPEVTQDGYDHYYAKTGKDPGRSRTAYQLGRERTGQLSFGVIEAEASLKAMRALAKDQGTTVTGYLTAQLIWAVHETMSVSEQRRPVVISVPVNLRKYFPSQSMRNFFAVILVSHDFSRQGKSLEEVLENVKGQFAALLSPEAVEARMSRMIRLEKKLAAKLTPLVLKGPGLKIGKRLFNRSFTAGLSNVGAVTMPQVFVPYIQGFDVFSSTRKLDICLCSYGDRLLLSFASSLSSVAVQRNMIRNLAKVGLDLTVDASREGVIWG